MMKMIYNMPLEYVKYGKPSKVSFDYAIDVVKEQARQRNVEISNIYMLGDNPPGDIVGANLANISSILVQSGVYTADKRSTLTGDSVPDFEVANMEEAVKLIMDLVGLKDDWLTAKSHF